MHYLQFQWGCYGFLEALLPTILFIYFILFFIFYFGLDIYGNFPLQLSGILLGNKIQGTMMA